MYDLNCEGVCHLLGLFSSKKLKLWLFSLVLPVLVYLNSCNGNFAIELALITTHSNTVPTFENAPSGVITSPL